MIQRIFNDLPLQPHFQLRQILLLAVLLAVRL